MRMNQLERFRDLSRSSRAVFWLILALFVAAALYAFFNSRFGQTALLCCCGGALVIAILGLVSERGMRKPR
jgi:4-hydroxybenzoate polyprenyltransferase